MDFTESEVLVCEELLRLADESYDTDSTGVLDNLLADDLLMIGPNGQPFTKKFVIDAHQPPKKQKFKSVKVSEMLFKSVDEKNAITCCRTDYAKEENQFSLRYLRVWQKTDAGWKLIAGNVTHIADLM
jgi:hypothetical protein